jgi:ABC-type lipoprotein export system ATPase subunit
MTGNEIPGTKSTGKKTGTKTPGAKSTGSEWGAEALIVCDNVVRIYQVDEIEVQALQGLDLTVDAGEMVAIIGASGSGKSTLLNVLSGLDVPTAGRARVGEWDLLRMSSADRLTYRRSVAGFIGQQTAGNLFPFLSASENIALPMAFAGVDRRTRKRRTAELAESLGLGDKMSRRPGELSGGEQQRVAIAVALANEPRVLFADEPTGELDAATGDDVFAALRSANRDLGTTVVIVTHDAAVSRQVQRTVAEEFAVLDRAGRLQLPAGYRTSLGMKSRVRLELEQDHIGVWPETEDDK